MAIAPTSAAPSREWFCLANALAADQPIMLMVAGVAVVRMNAVTMAREATRPTTRARKKREQATEPLAVSTSHVPHA